MLNAEITLSELMNKIPSYSIVFAGSGTGFFFIGNRVAFDETINEINEKYILLAKKKIKALEKDILKFRFYDFIDLVKIDNFKRDIKAIEDYIDNFVPFQNRMVIDAYKRISEDGAVALVDGVEKGDYWIKEEFDVKHRKQNGLSVLHV